MSTPLITLSTDFGHTDAYVGTMKGVIATLAPQAKVIDLTHGIPPQDVLSGAMALEESCRFFPEGTIHVAVVDPGVGSARAAVALETERSLYVGPDNGIFQLVLKRERLLRAVRLENPRYRLREVSSTFHGRDVFAPAAAHLANGVSLDDLGPNAGALVALNLPHPFHDGASLRIHILRSDSFGNLITDLTPDVFDAWNAEKQLVGFEFPHACFAGVCNTFSEVPSGMPLAYFGSAGRLEIAIRDGNAAAFFKAVRGTTVLLSKKS